MPARALRQKFRTLLVLLVVKGSESKNAREGIKTNTLATAGLLAVAGYFSDPTLLSNNQVIFLVSGCTSGVFLSPDLDVDNGYIGHYYLRRIWVIGPILEKIWEIYWWPYAKLIAHRSWASHFPGISTAIRMFLVFFPPYLAFGTLFTWEFLFYFWIGLTISDTYHSFADYLSKEIRE
ncbi:MAG: DUF2227 family putative metal-binding protein [Anaerolineales bacterium]|jgi:uncharacterized metal-binding protein|nr:DUF2227 family putative metal-binding protein [Anaerolineales bacterium]